MPRDAWTDTPKFCDGDRVRDRRGNVGFARWQQNRRGEWFWSIRIAEGPDKAKVWGKAYECEPMLDYPGGTVQTECCACDRSFKATAIEGTGGPFPKELYCFTHRARNQVHTTEDYIGSDDWKTRHHSRESKRFEAPMVQLTPEQVAEARRQREEDEKELPF